MRKLVETHLWYKGINTWAVLFVRYSELFLEWTREKLGLEDKKVDDYAQGLTSDRLCVSKRGRGFTSIEDYMDESVRGLVYLIKRSKKN